MTCAVIPASLRSTYSIVDWALTRTCPPVFAVTSAESTDGARVEAVRQERRIDRPSNKTGAELVTRCEALRMSPDRLDEGSPSVVAFRWHYITKSKRPLHRDWRIKLLVPYDL